VRRKEKALENPKDLEAILSQSTVCYLALKTKGAPYILPMSYGYHAGVLYFHCAPVGHKIDLLRREPEVGFHISEGVRVREGNVPCQFGVAYRSIIGTGRVRFLEERENKQAALKNTHAPAYRARGALPFYRRQWMPPRSLSWTSKRCQASNPEIIRNKNE
jgi:nitroimidazol reductase NimA-like FMN-containing flavoprotein (pyridoxamine 5'-phosphate oxidase superfamily)